MCKYISSLVDCFHKFTIVLACSQIMVSNFVASPLYSNLTQCVYVPNGKLNAVGLRKVGMMDVVSCLGSEEEILTSGGQVTLKTR